MAMERERRKREANKEEMKRFHRLVLDQRTPGLTEQNIEKNNRKFAAGSEAIQKEKKYEIEEVAEKDFERKQSIENLTKIKFEKLKIEKGIKDLESLNPLSMNIE